MRIANNIMAMNTHRQYTIQNDRVASSAEKLSSGYKINRAADDAAGLAISEKMRSQIRGLNRASLNSQDAASLIQTAEGALQEVHSMLQRMNELAVQSATGTNQEFDRTQIAKEFDQLKREINDIAEQTTFNNMKLLDGSLSNTGIKRSAATTGLYASVESEAGVKNVSQSAKAMQAAVTEKTGSVEIKLDENFSLGAGSEMKFDVAIGGNTETITVKNTGTKAVTDFEGLDSLMTTALTGKSFAVTGTDGEGNTATATLTGSFDKTTGTIKFADSTSTAQIDADLKATVGTFSITSNPALVPTGAINAAGTTDGTAGKAGTFSITLVAGGSLPGTVGDGATVSIDLTGTAGGASFSETLSTTAPTGTSTTISAIGDLAALFNGSSIELGGVTYDVSSTSSDGKLTFTAQNAGDLGASKVTAMTFATGALNVGGGLIPTSLGAPGTSDFSTSAGSNGTKAVVKTDAFALATGYTPAAGDVVTMNVKYGANDADFIELSYEVQEGDTAAKIAEGFAAKYSEVDFGTETFEVSESTGALVFTQKPDANGAVKADFSKASMKTTFTVAAAGEKVPDVSSKSTNSVAAKDAKPAENTVKADATKFKVGDTFTINGNTYEIAANNATMTNGKLDNGNYGVAWSETSDLSTLASVIDSTDADLKASVDANGDMIIKQATTTDKNGVVTIDNPKAGVNVLEKATGDKASTLEFDPAKLRDGDIVKASLTDSKGNTVEVEYIHDDTNSRSAIGQHFVDAFEAAGVKDVSLKGNAIRFESGEAKVELTPVADDSHETMRIQVGALENEQLSIEVKSMNTAGLKLDAHDIYTQDAAGAAITATREAINQVSDQRALLGAMQNRMTYKINNIKISTENLQAAESRIRDVDIASEMTNFTKGNILAQAATAMLAQANSAPQNVLSLLR